jgi:hypothetical protein
MKHQFVHVTNENLKESLYTAVECISPGDMAGFDKVTGYMNI